MKVEFITELEKVALRNKKIVFLTGDLGFHAFESIQKNIGERFINAGVAEQNMVSVASGLASSGLQPWIYSIASFLTLKTVEQVRNDICLLDLPVKLVGFGGGYGYGIMGESHHLLEDLAIYSSLPNMKIYIPAFTEDIVPIVTKMHTDTSPSYLRLNLAPITPLRLPKYSGVRKIKRGKKVTILVLGTLIHNVLSALEKIGRDHVADVFSVTEFPLVSSPELLQSIHANKNILIIEEHRKVGGLGEKVLALLGAKQKGSENYVHLSALGYPSGLYGDHAYHQRDNALDPKGILQAIKLLIK